MRFYFRVLFKSLFSFLYKHYKLITDTFFVSALLQSNPVVHCPFQSRFQFHRLPGRIYRFAETPANIRHLSYIGRHVIASATCLLLHELLPFRWIMPHQNSKPHALQTGKGFAALLIRLIRLHAPWPEIWDIQRKGLLAQKL